MHCGCTALKTLIYQEQRKFSDSEACVFKSPIAHVLVLVTKTIWNSPPTCAGSVYAAAGAR